MERKGKAIRHLFHIIVKMHIYNQNPKLCYYFIIQNYQKLKFNFKMRHHPFCQIHRHQDHRTDHMPPVPHVPHKKSEVMDSKGAQWTPLCTCQLEKAQGGVLANLPMPDLGHIRPFIDPGTRPSDPTSPTQPGSPSWSSPLPPLPPRPRRKP